MEGDALIQLQQLRSDYETLKTQVEEFKRDTLSRLGEHDRTLVGVDSRFKTHDMRLSAQDEALDDHDKKLEAESILSKGFVTRDDLETRLASTHSTSAPIAIAAKRCPSCGSTAHAKC